MTSTPDKAPTPTPAAPLDPNKVPLLQIIQGLTTKQALAIGGALVTIVLAAAGVGKWVEGWQREAAMTAAVAPKDDQIADLSAKVEQLETAVATAVGENQALGTNLADARRFIIFADKYITYLTSGEEPARSIFADHVCMLYRESQQADVGLTINTTSVARALDNVRAPGSRDALIAIGLNPALIDEIIEIQTVGIRRNMPNISNEIGYSVEPSVARVSPFNVNPQQGPISANDPRARDVAADVTKSLSGQAGELVKVVTFRLGGRDYSYTMPTEIAGLVHNNSECRLR